MMNNSSATIKTPMTVADIITFSSNQDKNKCKMTEKNKQKPKYR